MKQKRNFSSFNLDEAFSEVEVEQILEWQLEFEPLEPSAFFNERMRRLKRFDLKRSEGAKELIIDAFWEDALQPFEKLKMWKSVPLTSNTLTGVVDYLLTRNVDILDAPYLCLTEAKKDNFEQGLAQCLVEMKAARWRNEQVGKTITVFGVVSNGTVWQFYKMTPENQVFGTEEYGIKEEANILGILNNVLTECAKNL